MLPYVAFLLAVVFLILKLSGVLDKLTEFMRQRWEGQVRSTPPMLEEPVEGEEFEGRLEVFREFFEGRSEEDKES